MVANKKQVMAVMVISALALLPACWPFGRKVETKAATQDLYVVNVLDKNEYEDCRIAGSMNVPFKDIESFAKDLDKKTELVVYCANYMCASSAAAAQTLKEMGFENVWAYEGGTAEWYQMGLKAEGKYPVEGTCQAAYLLAANEKPAQTEPVSVPVINADELYEKMTSHGLIAMAQVTPEPAQVEEVSQQAAA